MQIEKWTQEQIEARAKKFPISERQDGHYVLKDGDLLMGFYATEEEAKEAQAEYELEEKIEAEFEGWVDKIAEKHKITPSQVDRIIMEYID